MLHVNVFVKRTITVVNTLFDSLSPADFDIHYVMCTYS
jgi:hypothetical protein